LLRHHAAGGRKATAFDELDVDALENTGAASYVAFDDAAFVGDDRQGRLLADAAEVVQRSALNGCSMNSTPSFLSSGE